LRPVIHLGLTLEMQEQVAVSRLHWVQMGFIKFPAGLLPQRYPLNNQWVS